MKRLDDWILEERIGSGGLADVYRAVPEAGGRAVALKVLREPDRSEAHRKRFLREGRLLERMSHPGLPRCSGAVDGERPYLVIELLTGRTLSERIKVGGPLDPQQTSFVALGILRVLAYLHNQGIVHRDVKSSNVYLADDRRILLLDLGLAADPNDPLTTTLGDVMGTYAYMAPEQLSGAEVDHRCDLYSLGVTLYEALAGVRPYQARGAAGYLQAGRESEPPALSELCPDAPARLLDTATRLMARDPAARPSSAGIALAMLTGSGGLKRNLEAPPLVGRAAAIGAIQASMDAGGTVIVTGEIGSGTSRMGHWALETARSEGFETIALRCSDRGPPQDVIDQLARDLGRLAGPVDPDPYLLGQAVRDQAGEGPLLIAIEGAEQCSEAAGLALARILRAAPMVSVVVTGVRPPPHIGGHVVPLRGLTVAEVAELVRGMLGTHSPPAGLARRLHWMSGGLPAIVVLAVKELVARQALWCEGLGDDGGTIWRLDRTVPLTPTTGLVRLFGEVLTSLPAPARGLLELLSVAGEGLPLDIALDVAGLDPSGVDQGPLLRAGLAEVERLEGEEWVRLRRPAVGALVVRQVPGRRQVALHRALADAISERPESSWRTQRAAWHRAHGTEGSAAAGALLALAEHLLEDGHGSSALEVLGRASAHHMASADAMARTAVVRGEALENLGRREEASEALNAGRRLAEDLGDDGLLARSLVDLATVYRGMGDERRAATLADEALDILDHRPDDPSLPRALLLSADNLHNAARPDEAAELYHRCIDVAMRHDRRNYAAIAHGALGVMLAEEGHPSDAGRHLSDAARFLRVNNQPAELIHVLYRLAICRRRRGLVQGAVEALQEAEQLALTAEFPYERVLVMVGQAAVELSIGDIGGARRTLRGARSAVEPDARSEVRLAYREVQLEVRLITGDHQAALATCQTAEVEAARAGHLAVGAYFLGIMGVLTADAEALTESMEVLGRGGDRRLAARLLLLGATVGGDAEVLASAEEEARACGDLFLLLEVLHASGAPEHRAEAATLVDEIAAHLPADATECFEHMPAVRWARERHRVVAPS